MRKNNIIVNLLRFSACSAHRSAIDIRPHKLKNQNFLKIISAGICVFSSCKAQFWTTLVHPIPISVYCLFVRNNNAVILLTNICPVYLTFSFPLRICIQIQHQGVKGKLYETKSDIQLLYKCYYNNISAVAFSFLAYPIVNWLLRKKSHCTSSLAAKRLKHVQNSLHRRY